MAYGATNQAGREVNLKPGKVIAFEMPAGGVIRKGSIVRVNAAGYAVSAVDLAQYDMIMGVALESIDNTYGVAGEKSVRVETEGVVQLLKGTPAVTDAGNFAVHATTNEQTIVTGADESATLTVGAIIGVPTDDMTRAASTTKEAVYLLTGRHVKA